MQGQKSFLNSCIYDFSRGCYKIVFIIKNKVVRIMKVLKKLISTILAITLIGSIAVFQTSAATRNQSLTRYRDYYDATIRSWKLGRVTGYLNFSYDDCSKKLISNKSANINGSVLLASVTNKKSKYEWYNTDDRNGSGMAVLAWDILYGIDTSWFKLGITADSCYTETYVYGNGTWNFK